MPAAYLTLTLFGSAIICGVAAGKEVIIKLNLLHFELQKPRSAGRVWNLRVFCSEVEV